MRLTEYQQKLEKEIEQEMRKSSLTNISDERIEEIHYNDKYRWSSLRNKLEWNRKELLKRIEKIQDIEERMEKIETGNIERRCSSGERYKS